MIIGDPITATKGVVEVKNRFYLHIYLQHVFGIENLIASMHFQPAMSH